MKHTLRANTLKERQTKLNLSNTKNLETQTSEIV